MPRLLQVSARRHLIDQLQLRNASLLLRRPQGRRARRRAVLVAAVVPLAALTSLLMKNMNQLAKRDKRHEQRMHHLAVAVMRVAPAVGDSTRRKLFGGVVCLLRSWDRPHRSRVVVVWEPCHLGRLKVPV